MVKHMTIMLILAGGSLGGIFGYKNYEGAASGRPAIETGPAPQTVSAVTAEYQQLIGQLRAVGSVRAVMGVDVSSQVAGTVAAIHFDSGAEVREGALLVQLAATEDNAKLQALMATAALSKLSYERSLLQYRVQAVSQHSLDTNIEAWKRDQALVDQQRALVELKSIRAPFSGVLSIRTVDIGQYLEAGTPIATLQAFDSVYLDFHIPQQLIDRTRVGQGLIARVDTYPDRAFVGKISAIDRRVDTGSRNVRVRATLANADRALLPGMFATVEIEAQGERDIAVPQAAINYHSYGNTVFLVEKRKDAFGAEQLAAREVAVTTGEASGDQIAILSGVEEGQTVVTAGQASLANGTPVQIDNSIATTADRRSVPAND